MPLLKNNAKRLITLNGPHTNQTVNGKVIGVKPGDKYDLLPAGAAVEVPQSVADVKYAKALIKTGDILVVTSTAVADDSDDESSVYSTMNKAELVELAESMDIEVGSCDTKAQIIEKIESAQ